LADGKCPIHPNRDIELRSEENYFFRWSKYQQPLLAYYAAHPDFVIPDFRFNEIRAFVERGLEDFSISRLATKMPWGVPVPDDCVESGDEGKHVMYVWFDALTNYVSTLGWPNDEANFRKFWGEGTPVQYCGKDNNRQQSAMWQAMLMSAGLPQTRHIVIDGFILGAGGQKMSKSLGNVISPFDVIEAFKGHTPFPEDVLRFVLLHDIPSFEDGELSMDSIRASYAANLQNGIGNLTSRIMKMATSYGVTLGMAEGESIEKFATVISTARRHTDAFDLHAAIHAIFDATKTVDALIQEKAPFKLIKEEPEEAKRVVRLLLWHLNEIALLLAPFLPKTSAEIVRLITEHKMPENPLFNRVG
jgi:methionyl-tRNA synthetase